MKLLKLKYLTMLRPTHLPTNKKPHGCEAKCCRKGKSI